MSALRLRFKSGGSAPIDLSDLTPATLAGRSHYEINTIPVSAQSTVGDHFDVSGEPAETLIFEGTTSLCDGIGSGLRSGTIVVEGHVGAYAARFMKSGRLDIRGNAGGFLAAGMKGGIVTLTGSAGDFVGALLPGEKFGMTGGTVHIAGAAGDRIGDRMRRGTIIVKGKTGAVAGSRMVGGTIWTETGFGTDPGTLLRRGTLIGPAVERMLPTFSDCGLHDMVFLRLISRHIAEILGPLAPKPLPPKVRRFAGDLATIGKGELLLTA
ncbi:MAG: formylmethanofuran dehydrogenase subunit C [Hyphomicrobium sp.]|nr:formylmethanofuran dehydrogenase subunit C [Hyphomicrobium sp.]